MKHLLNFLWLAIVWVTLWEVVSWANVIGGVVVAVAVMALVPPRKATMATGINPVRAVRLLIYFVWELLKASAIIAWEIVTPKSRVNPGIVSVQLTTQVPGIVVAVANMVSLTPGTLTVEVDEETMTLYIHVLHLKSSEETRDSVHTLERLTLAAFPPRPASPEVSDRTGLT